MIDELKTCPFCGSSNVAKLSNYIECLDCDAFGPSPQQGQSGNAASSAHIAWNTRAAPKVKPLAWLGGGTRYHTDCGQFVIEYLDIPHRNIWRLLQADFGTEYRGDFGGEDGLDSAKDVAEMINRRTSLSALEV